MLACYENTLRAPSVIERFVRQLNMRSGETDVAKPMVRVFSGPDEAMIDPFDVDLADDDTGGGRTVVTCLDPSGMNVEIDDFI